MSREHLSQIEQGRMTGIYLALLMAVGFDGPMLSRTEVEVAVLDMYGTVDGLRAHLGERDSYHADVVAAWVGLADGPELS